MNDLETLWHEYHAKLLHYAARRVGVDYAEDIVQAVYLRACEAINGSKGYIEHESGWLFAIAHNLIIDLYRARDKTPNALELDDGYEGEMVTVDGPTPHDLVERAIACDSVHDALRKLGNANEEQAIVIERRMEDYSFAEIAAELGKSDGAVKALMQRGYSGLHMLLGEKMGYGREREVIKESCVDDICDLLHRRGPMTEREIAIALRGTKHQVFYAVHAYRSRFVVVDNRKSMRGQDTNVYGLAGIHDRQAA